MKNFDALIVQRVADIDPKLWELSGQEHPFSSHQWYAFCEKVMPDCSPVHILLFRDGITFARGSFWLMRKDVLPIDSLLGRRAAAWMMKHKPLMVCRSPIANMSGISLPVIGRREALFALTQTAYQYAEKAGVSFVLYDYLSQQEVKPEVLPDGYGCMEIDGPGTALDIHWDSFEEFLSSLSKQAWKDYRRHSNQASKLGIRISIHSSVTDPGEAVDLIRRVEKHHGTMPNPWTEAILDQMKWSEASGWKPGRMVSWWVVDCCCETEIIWWRLYSGLITISSMHISPLFIARSSGQLKMGLAFFMPAVGLMNSSSGWVFASNRTIILLITGLDQYLHPL
jgi:hypothetical protein